MVSLKSAIRGVAPEPEPEPEIGDDAGPAMVRACRTRIEGRSQWLGVLVRPADAAGRLEPVPTADALVAAVEFELAAAGVQGPAQITLFFEL